MCLFVRFEVAQGQDFPQDQSNGPAYRSNLYYDNDGVVAIDDDRVILISSHTVKSIDVGSGAHMKPTKAMYQKSDKMLKVGKAEKLDLKHWDRELGYVTLKKMDEGHLMFADFVDRDNGKRILYAMWYDLDKMMISSDPVKVGEIWLGTNKKWIAEKFEIEVSDDRKSFAVFGYPSRKRIDWEETSIVLSLLDVSRKRFALWVYNDQFDLLNFRDRFSSELENYDELAVRYRIVNSVGDVFVILSKEHNWARSYNENILFGFQDRYAIVKIAAGGGDFYFEPTAEYEFVSGNFSFNPTNNTIDFFALEGRVLESFVFFTTELSRLTLSADNLTEIGSGSYEFDGEMYEDEVDSYYNTSAINRLFNKDGKVVISEEEVPYEFVPGLAAIDAVHYDGSGHPVVVMEKILMKTYAPFDPKATYSDLVVCIIDGDDPEYTTIPAMEEIIDNRVYLKNAFEEGYFHKQIRSEYKDDEVYMIRSKTAYRLDVSSGNVTSVPLTFRDPDNVLYERSFRKDEIIGVYPGKYIILDHDGSGFYLHSVTF